MHSGKIRGLKRRQKELDSWINFHRKLDIDRLKEYGYVYAKAKFGPWANLFNDKTYPAGYRKQLFSNLITFYFDWKKTLEKEFDKYYLKIWLSYPRFLDSQIVVAIGDRIDYYNGLFVKCDKQKDFPYQIFKNEQTRIEQFDWTMHYDYDYYLENDYLDLEMTDYLMPQDYYAEKRFYKRLIKNNVPYNLIDKGDGEERLFYIKKGYIWIGEYKN